MRVLDKRFNLLIFSMEVHFRQHFEVDLPIHSLLAQLSHCLAIRRVVLRKPVTKRSNRLFFLQQNGRVQVLLMIPDHNVTFELILHQKYF